MKAHSAKFMKHREPSEVCNYDANLLAIHTKRNMIKMSEILTNNSNILFSLFIQLMD